MHTEEPPSLWNFGEVDPWRRGRNIVLLFAILTAISQLLTATVFILLDNFGVILQLGVLWLFFWMQFYFIWIGWNWVRWLNGFVFASAGLIHLIWGMRDESGFQMVLGGYLLGAGICLGFAPSVHAFAKHQREKIGAGEIILTAAAFFLVICTLTAAFIGVQQLKLTLEADAFDFARTTFDRVFQDHDVAFLAAHASGVRKHSSPSDFMKRVENQLGELQGVDRPVGKFAWKIDWSGVRLLGQVHWEAQFSDWGRTVVDLDLTGDLHGWEIDHLRYN